LTVPWVAVHLGWRAAFLLTGVADFTWLIFWLTLYRRPEEHPRLSKAEFEYIRGDPQQPGARIPWAQLVQHRQTWAFAVGKFMTDPIWWFYLFWLPKYLNQTHGLSLTKLGLPLVAIYLMADAGSVAGGWLSSSLIKRGWTVNKARKTAMFVCACSVVPILFVSGISNLWVVVGLIGLATAAHQGWSANLFAGVSDMFPQRAVGSVVGIGGMVGAIGGMLIASAAGLILQMTHSYVPLFLIAGSAYLVALLLIQLLVPRMEPAKL
jgi:ACS family hexuronate transporter-like MFS transporter